MPSGHLPKEPPDIEVMGLRFTQPIEGYRKIKCAVGPGVVTALCFKVCGLVCAENCLRFNDKVCRGCPCLSKKEANP